MNLMDVLQLVCTLHGTFGMTKSLHYFPLSMKQHLSYLIRVIKNSWYVETKGYKTHEI